MNRSESFVTVCPRCGERFELRRDSIGKRIQCTNTLCRNSFEVQDPEAVTSADVVMPDGSPIILVAQGVVAASDEDIPILPASSLQEDSAVPEAIHDAVIVEVPATRSPSTEVQGEVQIGTDSQARGMVASPSESTKDRIPAAEPKRARASRNQQRKRRLVGWTAAVAGLFVITVACIFVLSPAANPAADWAHVQDEYYLVKKWKEAKKRFSEFARKHPSAPQTADVPFFEDMCDLGPLVYSDNANVEPGLQRIEELIGDYENTPQYTRFSGDVFQALQRIIERAVRLAERGGNPVLNVELAQRAYDRLAKVAVSIQEDWVPEIVSEAATQIASARRMATTKSSRDAILAEIERGELESVTFDELDAIYQRVARQVKDAPELGNDQHLLQRLDQLYRSEVGRVRYVSARDESPSPSAIGSAAPEPVSDDGSLFVVWDMNREPPRANSPENVVLTVARGVLYAFNPDGDLLWARRIGIDSNQPPVIVRPTHTAPALALVIDTNVNALRAYSVANGELVWSHWVPEDQPLAAPMSITKWRPSEGRPAIVRGLLPTANGEIRVLELDRGKTLGVFQTGSRFTVGGTFDPVTQLAYFPADSQRVFAIDPGVIDGASKDQTNAVRVTGARSTLITGHASGSLRSAPLIIGQYLVLVEAADVSSTRVKAFELHPHQGFADPQARPVKSESLRGWSWFVPAYGADRISVVTDEGDLGVFGLNLDNPSEALYPYIVDDNRRLPNLPISDRQRVLAIHCDDQNLWLMAGGSLRRLALDVIHQRVTSVWPQNEQYGIRAEIPVHDATFDWRRDRIYVCTQDPQTERIQFSAVQAADGKAVWRRQLGIHLATDPIPTARGVVLLDQSGRRLGIRNSSPPDRNTTPRFALGAALPNLFREYRVIRDEHGMAYYLGVADSRMELHLHPVGESKVVRQAVVVRLPGITLAGLPAVVGEFLVVPCSDGRIHRFSLNGEQTGLRNELPFSFAQTTSEAEPGRGDDVRNVPFGSIRDSIALYPQGEASILLIQGTQLERVTLGTAGGVTRWQRQGNTFHADRAIINEPLVVGEDYIVVDSQGDWYRFPRRALLEPDTISALRFNSFGRITNGPYLVGDFVVAVVNERKLIGFSGQQQGSLMPAWVSLSSDGRICGPPSALGNSILVTDDRGRIRKLSVSTGQEEAAVQLPSAIRPSGAAIVLDAPQPGPNAKDWMNATLVIPLADGHLFWLRPSSPADQLTSQRLAPRR